jgi:hypothetical protein
MVPQLCFENIRCFSSPQSAAIRPVTLLVGENSSGKSTFLALCQIASAVANARVQGLPFNEPPFLLGAYDQIASYRGGRAGRAKSFSISASVEDDPGNGSLHAQFVPKAGQPSLHSWRLAAGKLALEIKPSSDGNALSVLLESPRASKVLSYDGRIGAFEILQLPVSFWANHPSFKDIETVFSDLDIATLGRAWASIRAEFGRGTYAFAPIRTSPQRTYDPVSAEPKPEGSHVPMLLASLSHSAAEGQWTTLRSALNKFGSSSGLFEQIEVIRKGKKESDPFQIGVKTGGPTFNLVDVGYGVSQALPILVDTLLRSNSNEVFLLQQPEVHLHPRAQAELGSFFARLAGKRRRFVIETHSDYLVDRVRMEVRDKHLQPEDVSLLYFQREEHGAVIHNLTLDKDGNIANPPSDYRQFFLNEERSLLGI